MSILELDQRGVIRFLHKKGLLSSSTMTYIEYYKRFLQEKNKGAGYRKSIRKLSAEFGVSETTIKKAVRVIKEEGNEDKDLVYSYTGMSSMRSLN